MAELPLLIFPTPISLSERDPGQSMPPTVTLPSSGRQHNRLKPKFKELGRLLKSDDAEVSLFSSGIDPELILVFETVGSVQNFYKAINQIPGLEWLNAMKGEDWSGDDDFQPMGDRESIAGHLYVVSNNRKGLSQLRSCWNRWRKDNSVKLDTGLGPLKSLFKRLRDVRLWGPQDRLRESLIRENWEFAIEHGNQDEPIRFEAELWFRDSEPKRQEREKAFAQMLQSAGGQIVQSAVVEPAGYHGVLVELPRGPVEEVIRHLDNLAQLPATSFLQCNDVQIFSPRAQLACDPGPLDLLPSETFEADGASPTALSEPKIALLDGVPVQNHPLLSAHLAVDDPDDLAGQAEVSQRIHGTGMASLIIHGGLDSQSVPINSKLYVRPILTPSANNAVEQMPGEYLTLDLFYRLIRRMFEGEGDDAPTAPEVKIVNLSVCDEARPFFSRVSAWARLLDWAAWKYDVLFLVSCGNQDAALQLPHNTADFRALSPEDLTREYVRSIHSEGHNRRLMSPAESINALTIGATHDDDAKIPEGTPFIDAFPRGFPSPVNAIGGGFRRSVKPDLLVPGGRLLMRSSPIKGTKLEPRANPSPLAPGHRTSAPAQGGGFSKGLYACGTSGATALASRSGLAALNVIEQLSAARVEQGESPIDPNLHAVLVKGMLAHSASWPMCLEALDILLSDGYTPQEHRRIASYFCSGGVLSPSRIAGCEPHRATLLQAAEIKVGDAHAYRIPLPWSLSGKSGWRRIIITTAYMSPVFPSRQNYRGVKLVTQFESADPLSMKRRQLDANAVKKGTVQHEIYDGEAVAAITQGDFIEVHVNCFPDAEPSQTTRVKYSFLATFEVKAELSARVYQEVAEQIGVRIQPPVQIPTR